MKPFDYRALDDVIHARIRLGVMAILASVESAEFTYLRGSLKTTDGNLSTHLSKLTDAGYVEAVTGVGPERHEERTSRRPTHYRLSDRGRAALRTYLDRIESLLDGVNP